MTFTIQTSRARKWPAGPNCLLPDITPAEDRLDSDSGENGRGRNSWVTELYRLEFRQSLVRSAAITGHARSFDCEIRAGHRMLIPTV